MQLMFSAFVLLWATSMPLAYSQMNGPGVSSAAEAPATPLAALVVEAQRHNSQIAAASHEASAAAYRGRQQTTLPDPTLTFQELGVGSPKPFAGYTNSNFAYVGLGASQEVPFPGKLRLRGEAAKRAADVKGVQVSLTSATIVDAVKADYLQIAYLRQTLAILGGNKQILDQLIQAATIRYQVGEGMQQDLLRAQLERTRLLREVSAREAKAGVLEADLKGLLQRDQQTADIVPEAMEETPLRLSSAELLALAGKSNPQLQVDAASIASQNAVLESAKREGKPDFDLGYMYQNTDRKYRDYYMFTVNVHLPRHRRTDAAVGEAGEVVAASHATLDAHRQQQLAEVKQQYVAVTGDSDQLREYREGLIPQSRAAYRATLSAYSAGRETLARVLDAALDVLNLQLASAQLVGEHEIALARLETLTGASLR